MNLNDQLAREIIRERSDHHHSATRKPTHPRAAHALRRLAERLEGSR